MTTPGAGPVQPLPVILDVDTGIDDAYALMLAARSPQLDLRAVTCVAGNRPVEQVVANTAYVLDVTGAPDVAVARGAARPLLAAPGFAADLHGPDGLGGFQRPSDRRIHPLPAVELLHRELTAAIGNGQTITLVLLAPQTNLALLLSLYPDIAPGIERIVFMGGAATVGNVTAVAETNVFADPEAAAIVLSAAAQLCIPVTMYGLDVFSEVLVDRATAHRLRNSLDSAAQLAGALLGFQLATTGLAAHTIGDAGAVCAVLDPAGLTTGRFPVRVVTGDGPARGQTIVDRRPPIGRADPARSPHVGTEVDVARGVDADRFRRRWLSAFSPGQGASPERVPL
jgi:pyrimidine-specific ribonucleoside hydrolase